MTSSNQSAPPRVVPLALRLVVLIAGAALAIWVFKKTAGPVGVAGVIGIFTGEPVRDSWMPIFRGLFCGGFPAGLTFGVIADDKASASESSTEESTPAQPERQSLTSSVASCLVAIVFLIAVATAAYRFLDRDEPGAHLVLIVLFGVACVFCGGIPFGVGMGIVGFIRAVVEPPRSSSSG